MKKVREKEVKKILKELNILDKFEINNINKIYDIVCVGDDMLRAENVDVEDIDSVKELAINMAHTMINEDGCGIAAPQVGVNINMFLVKIVGKNEEEKEFIEHPLSVYINPRIVEYSDETEWNYEGCLSVDGFYALVERSTSIIIEYIDLNGNFHIDNVSGFPARAIQHEYDHLSGIVFTDICDILTLTTKENLMKEEEDV